MASTNKRHVAAVCNDGHIRLVEQETPPLKPGAVLVKVHNSLVSPGTEIKGWRGLSEKRKNPDPEQQSKPFGYSNSGRVVEVGPGVQELKPGNRIACIGGGYAMHTDYAVVPHHLCVKLPDKVTFEQGAYAMLAATALHALRRGIPEFGENAAIVGLGIVGQLAAQLFQMAGNYVIGWDTIGFRLETARRWGIHATAHVGKEDPEEVSKEFSRGYGLDGAVLAFGGDGNSAVESLEKCMKVSPDGHPMGRIVVVGGTNFDYTATLTNIDVRRASRTGCGYHDEAWEYGPAYPPVFMRWTTQTNLQLCMRLIEEGKLNVDVLTTHRIPLMNVDEGISAIIDDPDALLGVLFTMGV